MVKYIKSITRHSTTDIFAMSFPKKKALEKLDANYQQLADHVLKVILYKDIRKDDVRHWLQDEISMWLSNASNVRCKTKLKYNDYADSLFGGFGTDPLDALVTLQDFQSKYCNPKKLDAYPTFEITDELVAKVYNTYQKLMSTCIPILLKGERVSINDWYDIIKPIFKED